jgi:hypothetical protein
MLQAAAICSEKGAKVFRDFIKRDKDDENDLPAYEGPPWECKFVLVDSSLDDFEADAFAKMLSVRPYPDSEL